MARHFHYVIQAYRAETTEGGLADVTTLDLIVMPDEKPGITSLSDNRRVSRSDLEQVALERAQQFVSKPNYRTRDVFEHDESVCGSKR